MKKPVIPRSSTPRSSALRPQRQRERGVTMVLVAIAMIAVIAMAALSIDVITLYLAREEAQRSADSAALAAAKIISLSGLTGDPTNRTDNWLQICGPDDGTNGLATRTAKALAAQDTVGGQAATITVTYSAGGNGSIGSSTDCTTLASTAFGVNPMVTVQLTRASLPTFFSRIWGNSGSAVRATATAEAFNPSNSGNVGNQTTGTITPVQPRCVKPLVVLNHNPLSPGPNSNGVYCDNQDPVTKTTIPCNPIVGIADGSIQQPGISLNGTGATGVIGETFWLVADCMHGNPNKCNLRVAPPKANFNNGSPFIQPPPNLLYLPGQVGTQVTGIPACTTGDPFEEAVEGCDEPTNYSCGVPNAGNAVDLRMNPADPTSTGVQCLIRQGDRTDVIEPTGQDYLNPYKAPSAYPFQVLGGTNNPLIGVGLSTASPSSSSVSIVSLPIYDNTTVTTFPPNAVTNVTFVGFLQVFINAADKNGNVNVTVLNVAGCSNGSGNPVGSPVVGNSPVPVRLITPP